jgi:hypothetical protein
MSEWKQFFSPATDALIEQFELEHGVVLPPHYRAYLTSVNGGQPIRRMCFTIPGIAETVMLGGLFGLTAEAGNRMSIATVIAESNDDFPSGYIPIGTDPGGNLLLLATSEEQQDGIFFRDRVGFIVKRTGQRMFPLADNISVFLASLELVDN